MILTKDIRIVKIGTKYIYHDVGTLPRLVFDPDAIVGMDDTPEVRRDTVARPWSHGNFSEQNFYEARLVSLSGHALARSVYELHKMRDELVYQFRGGQEQWVSFSDGSGMGTRHIRAALGSRITWTQMTDTYAQWRFELYASDPRMYSNLETSQLFPREAVGVGMVFPMFHEQYKVIDYNLDGKAIPTNLPLENLGNEEAWPTLTVVGNFSRGFTIKTASKTLEFDGTVSKNAPVVIDTLRGTALQNGVDRSFLLSKRGWMSIPPYGSITLTYMPNIVDETPDTYVNVAWRSTWI